MRKNEHPGCSCASCKRGRGSAFGHFIHKQVARKIRRSYKLALKTVAPEDTGQIIVSTPYTD